MKRLFCSSFDNIDAVSGNCFIFPAQGPQQLITQVLRYRNGN